MMSVRFLKAMLSCVCLALIGSSAAVCVHGDARVAVRQGQAEFVPVAKFQERERDRSLWEEMLAMERRLQRFREEGDVEECGGVAGVLGEVSGGRCDGRVRAKAGMVRGIGR